MLDRTIATCMTTRVVRDMGATTTQLSHSWVQEGASRRLHRHLETFPHSWQMQLVWNDRASDISREHIW